MVWNLCFPICWGQWGLFLKVASDEHRRERMWCVWPLNLWATDFSPAGPYKNVKGMVSLDGMCHNRTSLAHSTGSRVKQSQVWVPSPFLICFESLETFSAFLCLGLHMVKTSSVYYENARWGRVWSRGSPHNVKYCFLRAGALLCFCGIPTPLSTTGPLDRGSIRS